MGSELSGDIRLEMVLWHTLNDDYDEMTFTYSPFGGGLEFPPLALRVVEGVEKGTRCLGV
jgi:hypothetical protein